MDPKDIFAEQNAENSSAPPHLLSIIWRHRFLFVFGICVGALIGSFYYLRTVPIYQSSARLHVVRKQSTALPLSASDSRSITTSDDFLSFHPFIFVSQVLIERAIEKHNLKSLPSFQNDPNPVATIAADLRVVSESKAAQSQNLLLYITYNSTEPADNPKVIDAMIDAYKEYLDSTYENVSVATVKLITQAQDVLDNKVKKVREEYQNFRKDNPKLFFGTDGADVSHELIVQVKTRQSALLIRKLEIEGRLSALEQATKEGRSQKELLTMVADSTAALLPTSLDRGAGADRPRGTTADDGTIAMLMQLKQLTEDYGSDHPQVKLARERMEMLKYYGRLPSTLDEKESDSSRIEGYIKNLQNELDYVKSTGKILDSQLAAEEAKAGAQGQIGSKDEAFRKEIRQNEELYDSVKKSLQEINILKSFGGYETRLLAPAQFGAKISPRMMTIFPLALLMGAAFGLGLGFLADVLYKGFHNVEDVGLRLGLPLLGSISKMRPAKKMEPSPLDSSLLCYFQPESRESEGFRALRTAINFSVHKPGHKVIQITSPEMGDGKTTVLSNLAVSMASAKKRVLLIDADLRRPRLHKIFGLDNDKGLSSILQGEREMPEVIESTAIVGLDVLPSGPLAANPAELLALPRFKELIDSLRERYDFVLIDTPPVLAVTDPCITAALVDGVLLTLKLSKSARPNALRAKNVLASLGAKILGVVPNGVERRQRRGGYYYEYSNYSNYRYVSDEKKPEVRTVSSGKSS